jgi:hypothetical protein
MHTFCRVARHFMNLTKNKLVIFCLTILIGLGTITRSAGAQSGSPLDLDFHQVPWTHLSFFAKNFWVEVLTDIQLSSVPSSDLDPLLLKSPRGTPIKPETAKSAQMTINTIIDSRFRSPVNIHNSIWFNPTDASAFGRVRLRRGEDDFKKIYRFTEQGVFRHRIEPRGKKEVSQAPEKWTDIKDSFYPYDLARLGCPGPGVIERSLLLYIISAAGLLEKNDTLSLCVFDKRQLHRVTLQHASVSPIKVDYIEKSKQGEIRRQEIVKAIEITLSSEPLESDLKENEKFSFLGLHKDITIHIDPASGIPIQASGTIPTAGRVILNLNKVWLKN